MFRIEFDEWQHGIGRVALSKRADGSYAASVGGVVMSIPRQTGKTYLIGWMIFALCTIYENTTVVWTAHRTRTSDETFEKMKSMALRPRVAKYIEGRPRSANGQQTITFTNGSRILFGAREQGFGRGFDEIDVLVLDEAQILTENAMSDMVPATNAAKNGLVFLLGTPPRPGKDPGEVFAARRADALAGDPDTAYVEFSADPQSKIIDWDQVAKANPSFPHRTSKTAILRMQKLLGSDESFMREAYGIWDEAETRPRAIDASRWHAGFGARPPNGTHQCFAVKFTPDGAAVGLAGAVRDGDRVHVDGLRQANAAEGMQWLVDFIAKREDSTSLVVVDGKSGAGALFQALKDQGVTRRGLMLAPTFDQVIQAHSQLQEAIRSGAVTHGQFEALDDQAVDAIKRFFSKTSGAFGWQSSEGGPTPLLDAVTLAYWASKTTTVNMSESRGAASRRRASNTGRGR